MVFSLSAWGALQILLDTGQRKDWLGSRAIRIEVLCCIAGLIAFVSRELTVEHPIVDLRALKNRSFAVGVLLMSAVGFCLYSSLVLLPAIPGNFAELSRPAGWTRASPWPGLLCPHLYRRRHRRPHRRPAALVTGFLVGAATMFMLSNLNLNAGYWDIFWPQVLQGGAMACMFIPLSTATMSNIRREKMGNATSIFNLMRNIGGSVGIAAMTTLLARRQQFHQNRLVEHIRPGQPQTWATLHQFTQYFVLRGADPVTASRQAYGALLGQVQQQAAMLSFVEAFKIMGIVFLVMVPLVALLKDPKKSHTPKHAAQSKTTSKLAEEAPAELIHT